MSTLRKFNYIIFTIFQSYVIHYVNSNPSKYHSFNLNSPVSNKIPKINLKCLREREREREREISSSVVFTCYSIHLFTDNVSCSSRLFSSKALDFIGSNETIILFKYIGIDFHTKLHTSKILALIVNCPYFSVAVWNKKLEMGYYSLKCFVQYFAMFV